MPEKYTRKNVIYFERGFVALCKILNASANKTNEGKAYSFNLKILRCFQMQSTGYISAEQDGALEIDADLEVCSILAREENGQIIASGYIWWTIVLDPDKIDEIVEAIHKAESLDDAGDWIIEPYGTCRAVTDERFRKRIHPVLLRSQS